MYYIEEEEEEVFHPPPPQRLPNQNWSLLSLSLSHLSSLVPETKTPSEVFACSKIVLYLFIYFLDDISN